MRPQPRYRRAVRVLSSSPFSFVRWVPLIKEFTTTTCLIHRRGVPYALRLDVSRFCTVRWTRVRAGRTRDDVWITPLPYLSSFTRRLPPPPLTGWCPDLRPTCCMPTHTPAIRHLHRRRTTSTSTRYTFLWRTGSLVLNSGAIRSLYNLCLPFSSSYSGYSLATATRTHGCRQDNTPAALLVLGLGTISSG